MMTPRQNGASIIVDMNAQNDTPAPQWQSITPGNPPQFPCWLFVPAYQDMHGYMYRTLNSDAEESESCKQFPPTHWHPDQSTVPIAQPEREPKTLAEELGESLREAAAELEYSTKTHVRRNEPQPIPINEQPAATGTPETDAQEKSMQGQTFTANAAYAYTLARKLEKQRDAARAEVERWTQRLQIDPGGSDKIDELEQALQFLRHSIEVLTRERDELRGDLQRIANGCGVGHPDREESIKRIIQLAASRPTAEQVEACARELFPELCTGLSDDHYVFVQKVAILAKHFNPEKKA